MKLSIGKKLTAGFGIVIVLWGISSCLFLWQVGQIRENLTEVVSRAMPMEHAASEMEINLIGTGFALAGYLNDLDPIHLERMENDRGDFERAQADYKRFAGTELEQDLAVQMDNGYRRFREQAARLIEAHDDQTTKMAMVHKRFDQIDDILDEKIEPAIKPEDPQGYEKLNAAMELEINVNGIAKGLGLFLRERTADSEARVEKDTQDFYRFLQQYRAVGLSREEQQWAEEIDRFFEQIVALSKTVIALEKIKMQGIKAFVKLRRELDGVLDESIQPLTEKDLLASEEKTAKAITRTSGLILIVVGIGTLAAIGASVAIGRTTVGPLRTLTDAAKQVQQGDLQVHAQVKSRDETGMLANAFNIMVRNLRESKTESEERDWLKTGLARINDVTRGDPDVTTLASKVISEMATYLDAQVGALYLAGNGDGTELSLLGSYAYTKRKNLSNRFKAGQGLVGQAALEKQQILVKNVPEDYVKVTSGLGERVPRFICVTPCLYEGRVKGVAEIGTLSEMTKPQMEYLAQAMDGLGMAVESAHGRTKLAGALKESQSLSEELQTQQEELKTANEELEEQTQILKESEEELKAQQEELQVTNEELEEKTEFLERQKTEVEQANVELEETRQEIEEKAEDLALASKYKSEFLANMSHELRTPLNSLLILASSLEENEGGNLTDDQVESARVIHGSGNDLLSLINEILDLSKIEAGQMDLHIEKVSIKDLADSVRTGFEHVCDDKGLELKISIDKSSPAEITSDRKRIEQVIRNLVSNAVKFTGQGGVAVTFAPYALGNTQHAIRHTQCLSISVADTGIGIPDEKQKVIFEAFQQADGGTARKYGGTGLGLSICRELVRLLGGEIRLESEEGKGSVFSVYLPIHAENEVGTRKSERGTGKKKRKSPVPTSKSSALPVPSSEFVSDDRDSVAASDTSILVIEDDPVFAKLLLRQCREKGFKCLVAATGEEGLRLACEHAPSAAILDIRLPGIDGWSVLDQLKERVETRHVPVHIMSVEEPSQDALSRGAIGFLRKPVSPEDLQDAFGRIEDVLKRKMKGLLVVEDDNKLRKAIVKLVGNGDVHTDETATGKAAIQKLKSKKYDCMILDLNLSDMSGFELLEKTEKMEDVVLPPVVVYTGRDLTREEDEALRKYSESIIVKGVRSQERLFDEVSLFLHRVVEKMPKKKRQIITDLHDADSIFKGKEVLIVDDDMRNLFALSNALSTKGIRTRKAEDGKKALEMLKARPDVDLVLMDVMMPVMDGCETMKRIRAQERFNRLPIIALTAKAMKQDRRKCIDAGANDYLPKPVDVNRLFSMMRVWMYR